MIMRLRAWLIERLGGELPEDWGVEYEWSEPDYYTEDGIPVYDLSARLHRVMVEHNTALAQTLEFGRREEPVIDWMADDGC